MADQARTNYSRNGISWRIVGWSIPVILLLLPLAAMHVTNEVRWTPADFIYAAALFGSVGAAFEVIARQSDSLSYRVGAGFAVIAAFLTVWINGAVGMIGSEHNPYNLLFGGVLLVALCGGMIARLRAPGMARAMLGAALAQVVISAIGFSTDPLGGAFSLAFAAPWLLSALLFRCASSTRR